MSEVPLPKNFTQMRQQHPKLAEAIDTLGQAVKPKVQSIAMPSKRGMLGRVRKRFITR